MGQIIKFEKCPACGGERRVYQSEANKMVLDGRAGAGFQFRMAKFESVIATPDMQDKQPVGSSLPVVTVFLDACLDCGCVYVTDIEISQATKHIRPPAPLMTNTKLIHGKGLPPGHNNPFLG